tara:strand:- start:5 stop:352 length:348 start_codon:yes stop_codon:yes gene_type:complete
MTDRRPLGTDLTDQGKWQAEHGATPDPIVALDDGDTWTLAEGCRLIVPTPEHGRLLSNGDMKVNDVRAVAEYNIDAMPELVKQLRLARLYVDAIPRLRAIDAALDAAIEHEGGAS